MSEHSLGERIAKLETLYEHLDEKLDEIKAAQSGMAGDVKAQLGQMSGSVRRMEDKFVQVGAWKMAIVAFLPILGGVVGAKFSSIAAFFGFK